MLKNKKGASAISLILCAIVISILTVAIVVAASNSATFRANERAKKEAKILNSQAYTKVYTLEEVQEIAKQAFVDNYISFYEEEVSFTEFKDLILAQINKTIPSSQMVKYNVYVYNDGVTVQYK